MKDIKDKTTFEKYLDEAPNKEAIRELYLGHIGNYKHTEDVFADDHYKKALAKLEDIKSKLIPQLNDEQKLKLNKLQELEAIQEIDSNISSYEHGFKLDICLGFESGQLLK